MRIIIILVGLMFQILGIVLLVSRVLIPQPGLFAMSFWLLIMGAGLLILAKPSSVVKPSVKPCPELNSKPCPLSLTKQYGGFCPITWEFCPSAPGEPCLEADDPCVFNPNCNQDGPYTYFLLHSKRQDN